MTVLGISRQMQANMMHFLSSVIIDNVCKMIHCFGACFTNDYPTDIFICCKSVYVAI